MIVIGVIIAGIGGITALLNMSMNGKASGWAGWGFLMFFIGSILVYFSS